MIGFTWLVGFVLLVVGLIDAAPVVFIAGASLMGLCAMKGEIW